VDRSCGFGWEPPAQKLTLDVFVYIWRKGEVYGMESELKSKSESDSDPESDPELNWGSW